MAKSKKTRSTKKQQTVAVNSEFCTAVAASDAGIPCSPGLQAIESKDPLKISKPIASLNLDKAKAKSESRANRWDYGIGYLAEEEQVVWVEVHTASTNELDTMQKKLAWLKEWLEKPQQKQLSILTQKTRENGGNVYVWVATGSGVHFRDGSPKLGKLRQAGLKGPVRGDSLP